MKPAGRIDLPERMRDPAAVRLFAALDAAGIAARFVGGCVRNAVLRRGIDDIDLAVSRPPETVMLALQAAKLKAISTGLKHGTVTAVVDGRVFELTTLRRDVETDGRHAVVSFTDDWLEDAQRRDFTFNALYAERDGTLYDPFDGRADLALHKVRFIGDADQRIAEDRLRVLRFFRFHAWYGAPPLDGPGFQACARHAGALGSLSGERVAKEVLRLLAARDPADAIEAMADAGALDHWLPEYDGTRRLRALIARESEADGLRRLASALEANADARTIGKRLKLSTQQALRLEIMLAAEPAMDVAGGARAWRAQIYRIGTSLYTDRLLLAVDAAGDWRAALALVQSWSPPELPVSGGDALKLGLTPGPKVGALLDQVERWWVAGDFAADRDACLAELGETHEERMIRPGLAFALWLAIAGLVVVNDMIGDTVIAERLPVISVEWYKALVPLPYVVLMAVIHARRTRGPQWLGAALLAALLWPTTTVLADYFYEHWTFGQVPVGFLDRFAFWWGAPYPLLVIALFAAPLLAGWMTQRCR